MNALIIEDQKRLADAIGAILEDAGYNVDIAYDGISGLDCALLGSYDIILLDVMLPGKDGFEIIAEVRKSKIDTPVIMLTAREALRDKVTGLDLGADDYLTKPFQAAELLARLRALTRRKGELRLEQIDLGNTTLDLTNAMILSQKISEPVQLSQREFELCKLFMSNIGRVFSKQDLLVRVWGMDNDVDENSVEAYVSFLRKKFAFIGSNLSISTIRMLGYKIEICDE